MGVIVRIWRTGIHRERLSDYHAFAHGTSLPMFHQQRGCRGVIFAAGLEEHAVITLWGGMDDVAQLENSRTYQDTVHALLNSGILEGEQSVEVLNAEVGFLGLSG